ncbi:MAG: NAD-dependent epimerase/dehydratase [Planctomycetes bacterium]|nr:NAD-dependent epimerase/dehydratase [Planctomycetota bacterium]
MENVEALETKLSEPTPEVVELFRKLDGDLILLGVAGKMGPTLARMAVRAAQASGKKRRVIGVARFSNPAVAGQLEKQGVEIVRTDLLDSAQVEKLPDAANIIWMGGMKFGTTGQESLTWAMNTHAPALICSRYRHSRIVAFSSGNVYGLSPVVRGGSAEGDPLNPAGEYALSALGRERIFDHFSRAHGIPMVLLRLNYAVEMRYGVLVDIARKVFNGETIDVSMGNFNVIWQGDANAMALRTFEQLASPSKVLNITGPETLSVRRVAERFAALFQKKAAIVGTETPDALLNNAQLSHRLFGYPRIGAEQMIEWIAAWVKSGGVVLGKPTHFESRDGKY